jgi:hypothetical protein
MRTYPGNGLSYIFVSEVVMECGHCQKYRHGHADAVTHEPFPSNLDRSHPRRSLGIDRIAISP